VLKLIVFDWDGTLADSVSKIIKCKHDLAQSYNLAPPDQDLVRSVLGIKFEDAMKRCFPNVKNEMLRQLMKEFHELMQQEAYQSDLFPGARDMLLSMKARGLTLAVATSKARVELDKALAYNRLDDVFAITCCGHEYQEKPHPAMLNYMMQTLNVRPDECLFVGDTVTDLVFAHNSDVTAVGVTFGAQGREKLSHEDTLALIDDWKELNEIMDLLCHSSMLSFS